MSIVDGNGWSKFVQLVKVGQGLVDNVWRRLVQVGQDRLSLVIREV